nr:MAG TPA: hypothetical protein [Caudoviricetes sp.]
MVRLQSYYINEIFILLLVFEQTNKVLIFTVSLPADI